MLERDYEGRELVRFFCKHMVALGGTQVDRTKYPSLRRRFLVAGVVMSFAEDLWFFVTAGHALEKLEQAIRIGSVESLSLIDYMGIDAIDGTAIPFQFDDPRDIHFVHNGNGVDFGFFWLEEHYCQLMRTNGVAPLDESRWLNLPEPPADAEYLMLGLPSVFVSSTGPISATLKPTLISIQRLPEVPPQYQEDMECGRTPEDIEIRDKMFYGQIDLGMDLPKDERGRDNIEGMNGGPILLLTRHDDGLQYRIVALQTSWFRESRITRGVPIDLVGFILLNALEDSAAWLHGEDAEGEPSLPDDACERPTV